ncbi:MarC family protein [Sulfurospirillum arcachonense]|uniref:MarC family protein n=1 Tax=Sulfurospirillum arcachonense TaxID=57666 RepID=UPI000468196E|nr:MarC family protein [Sulfurospirillum arcachonense]
MIEFFDLLLQHTITMMAIVDPLGVSAVMLSLLPSTATKEEVNKIAYKSTLTIIIAFVVVLFTGNFLLKIFGIELDSLKVMGGIVLLMTGIKMVNGAIEGKNQTKEEKEEAKMHEDFSIIPLAIPITFGPGIFATVVILKGHTHTFVELLALVMSFLLVALAVYLSFKNSIYIKKYLGITGQKIISRLMGLIVGAIAVQFILSGIYALLKGYGY